MAEHKKITWEIDENNCWNCTSHYKSNGYPVFWWDGKCTNMSRFIWEQMFGEIPLKMEVCHKCDNPACINPEHLFLGTHFDNLKDCMNKNRSGIYACHKGETHGMAKLTKEQVKDILSDTRTHKTIANQYEVTRSTISYIKSGKLWKCIYEQSAN